MLIKQVREVQLECPQCRNQLRVVESDLYAAWLWCRKCQLVVEWADAVIGSQRKRPHRSRWGRLLNRSAG